MLAIGAIPGGGCPDCGGDCRWTRFDREYLLRSMACILLLDPHLLSDEVRLMMFNDCLMIRCETHTRRVRMGYARRRSTCGCDYRGKITGQFDYARGVYVRRRHRTCQKSPVFGVFARRDVSSARLPSTAEVARFRAAAVVVLGRRGEAAAAWVGF